MVSLTLPTRLQRKLIQSVEESVGEGPVQDWSEREISLCLTVLQGLRRNAEQTRQALEEALTEGMEAGSLVRELGPFLNETQDRISILKKLSQIFLSVESSQARRLNEATQDVITENQALTDSLNEALSVASMSPRPIDWDRVQRAEEAHASGRTKPFSKR